MPVEILAHVVGEDLVSLRPALPQTGLIDPPPLVQHKLIGAEGIEQRPLAPKLEHVIRRQMSAAMDVRALEVSFLGETKFVHQLCHFRGHREQLTLLESPRG